MCQCVDCMATDHEKFIQRQKSRIFSAQIYSRTKKKCRTKKDVTTKNDGEKNER